MVVLFSVQGDMSKLPYACWPGSTNCVMTMFDEHCPHVPPITLLFLLFETVNPF